MRNLFLALCIFFVTSCYLERYPLTPQVTESASYKIYSDEAMGTAWAINEHHVITAGHVCEGVGKDFVLVSESGRRIRAVSTAWEKSNTSGLYDLCVLKTDYPLPTPLVISSRMPHVGERVDYTGYPNGIFTQNTGVYLGDLDGPDSDLNDAVFTAQCDHGASGSAVYIKDGVWGVLVRLRLDEKGEILDGTHGCVAIPLKQLRAFLEETGTSFDSTPDEVPENPFAGED